jgi:hydrogenase nickel incorporation protein HypA/HybF
MHEMGIVLEVIKIATDSVPADAKGARIRRINLEVGRLSAVVPESLTFCFDVASKDTPVEGAELNIEVIPVTARCKDCGAAWVITEPAFSCRKCESAAIEILSGRELDIKSIEIST